MAEMMIDGIGRLTCEIPDGESAVVRALSARR